MRTCVLAASMLAVAGQAAGQVTDTFTAGGNAGGWSFGGPTESIPASGGNPGYYLRSAGLDTTIPWLRCAAGSPFTGNFRAAGYLSASVDLNVFSTDFNIGAFPVALILYSNNGTANTNDDWAVYKLGDSIPAPGTGWKQILFDIPSGATSLPAGWGYMQFGSASPPAANWNAVITNVTRLEFSFGDPTNFYIFQMWTVGADNVSLRLTPTCYANCDQSTVAPILNVNDFMCFMNLWAAADPYANCDHNDVPPPLNANDFQCFLNVYAAGCS